MHIKEYAKCFRVASRHQVFRRIYQVLLNRTSLKTIQEFENGDRVLVDPSVITTSTYYVVFLPCLLEILRTVHHKRMWGDTRLIKQKGISLHSWKHNYGYCNHRDSRWVKYITYACPSSMDSHTVETKRNGQSTHSYHCQQIQILTDYSYRTNHISPSHRRWGAILEKLFE